MARKTIRHSWTLTPAQAVALQRELAPRVIARGNLPDPTLIAGADLAFSPDGKMCIAGVVVWHLRDRTVVEQQTARVPVAFPYVPGLLTFREAPALLAAIGKLKCGPDAFLFDGQGIAHPRGLGLASHLGLRLDRPTVGCAKSILVGTHADVGLHRGDSASLIHRNRRVGVALRTRDRVKPVYVSVGHQISLARAVRLVLECGGGFRLPEPTRLADQLVRRRRGLAW